MALLIQEKFLLVRLKDKGSNTNRYLDIKNNPAVCTEMLLCNVFKKGPFFKNLNLWN